MKGRAIVISGPDGAGKSALADALVERLGGPDHVRRFHGRAPILPRRDHHVGPVPEPHAKTPYGRLVSIAKVCWLAFDNQLMWRVLVPSVKRAGRDVVIERGWWDHVVDPRRYRLSTAGPAAALGRLLPSPDLEVVLSGSPAVLMARKDELPEEEIERQTAAWHALRPAGPRTLHLDAARPIVDLTDAVMDRLADRRARAVAASTPTSGWVHLPPRAGRPRWQIPSGPRGVATAALRVYHPVTRRATLGWRLARVVARFGGFRLLARHPRPDIVRVLADALPADTIFAVANAQRAQRASVLALDPTGRPIAVAKVAADPVGRQRIVQEGDIGERLRLALPAPLCGPRLLASGDGYLLYEAVDWVTRSRAWELPEDVAFAMGRFHAAGRVDGVDAGYTHGDFAPWNLLRTATGWSLVDWADARDDGPAFFDPLHYLVQSHALLGRPSRDEILDGVRGEGPVAAILAAYARGAGLDTTDLPTRLADYLDSSEHSVRRARLRIKVSDLVQERGPAPNV